MAQTVEMAKCPLCGKTYEEGVRYYFAEPTDEEQYMGKALPCVGILSKNSCLFEQGRSEAGELLELGLSEEEAQGKLLGFRLP